MVKVCFMNKKQKTDRLIVKIDRLKSFGKINGVLCNLFSKSTYKLIIKVL